MEKHSQEEAQTWRQSEGRSSDVETVRREKIRDGEDQTGRQSEERKFRCAIKVGKSRNAVFFQCFVARRVDK